MRGLRRAFIAFSALGALLVFASPAKAQPGRGERIAAIVSDCDARADEFQRLFRRALEHSGYRGSMRQADLDRHADELSGAMRRMRETWNRERDIGRSRRAVEEAVSVSRAINRVMRDNRFYPELHRKWDVVRNEVDRLADAFGVPRIRWD